jgi:long-chain acyl-CoA synthetase
MSMILDRLIERHGRYRSDHLALVIGDERLSWREFDRRVNCLSNALVKAGIGKGDKVATVLPNCVELITLYWAITSIGAVVVPLSPLLQPRGLLNLLHDSGSRLVFLTDKAMQDLATETSYDKDRDFVTLGDRYIDFLADAKEIAPTRKPICPADLFNIVYSSGTTGLPKGIEHSHLVRSQYGAHFASSFRMTPESVVLHSGSIVFNGAFVTLMPCFYLGATYILHKAFDIEETIRAIRDEKVTHIMMVPAQIIALLESPNCSAKALASLEMVLTLGAPLSEFHKKAFNKILPGRYYELYGLTEGFVTILDKLDFEQKSGSVGCPPPGYDMRIVDDEGVDLPVGEIGEIVGRGPILMSGYYGREDLTDAAIRDGWLFTGDLGYLDDDGYLYLAGRKKDMIISGGVNVFPQDIESLIVTHESVLETAVFGIASDKWGETPIAAVMKKPGAEIDTTMLKEWINQRVEAKFQRVADVFFIETFPRNVAGKILKYELQELYSENSR